MKKDAREECEENSYMAIKNLLSQSILALPISQ